MPFGGLGFGELILIFAVLLLLFGAKRLPELASGMGRGIRDFKRALNGMDEGSIQANQTRTIHPGAAPEAAPAAQAGHAEEAPAKPPAAAPEREEQGQG